MKKILTVILVLAAVSALGLKIYLEVKQRGEIKSQRSRAEKVIPVEVELLARGPISEVREFSATLEASQEFVVAAKISGRIEQITVDMSDAVTQGQTIARLDNAEYQQAVTQAQADVAVAKANLQEAESLLTIASRELERTEKLQKRGVSTEAERDTAKANQLARAAHKTVSQAQLQRARAADETARIRLEYSNITTSWQGQDERRFVAERYVNEGESVNANQPIIRVVKLDQLNAIFYVSERDYAMLSPQQSALLQTDAYPVDVFKGRITRVAPVFKESSRQARVELKIDNSDLRLKPGMFMRSRVVLRHVDDALIVPETALVLRNDETGVFVLQEDTSTVTWQPIKVGIRQSEAVEAIGSNLTGKVVVLGQQLIKDGSKVLVQKDSIQ